jgi:hypothetical protein
MQRLTEVPHCHGYSGASVLLPVSSQESPMTGCGITLGRERIGRFAALLEAIGPDGCYAALYGNGSEPPFRE